MAGRNYIWDEVLEPPRPPLTIAWDATGPTTEMEEIASMFNNGLPNDKSTLVRYRQSGAARNTFFCHWYAYARLEGLVQRGKEYPTGTNWIQDDLDQETSETFRIHLADKLDLIPCADNDPKRILLVWLTGTVASEEARVGHVQVREGEYWESKMSSGPWVICHKEDLYADYYMPLVKAVPGKRYYKRKPQTIN